jgi:hypothetical protein
MLKLTVVPVIALAASEAMKAATFAISASVALQVFVHRLFVERVDFRRLSTASGGSNVFGDRIHRCPMAPGEIKVGPLARKGVCDSAADRPSGPTDHDHLVL